MTFVHQNHGHNVDVFRRFVDEIWRIHKLHTESLQSAQEKTKNLEILYGGDVQHQVRQAQQLYVKKNEILSDVDSQDPKVFAIDQVLQISERSERC
jgi:pyruvate carboxylase